MNAGELTLPIREAAGPNFEQILAQHQQRVLRTAYRLLGRIEDAQDVSQEVFLRLLKHWDSVEGDPSPWLYRVTVNVWNDHYRGKLTIVEAPERPDPSPRVDRVLEMDQRKALLMAGLKTLADRERNAVVL